jgi:hypothetical protein
MVRMRLTIVLALIGMTACSTGGDPEHQAEVARARSGDVEVVLLSEQPLLAQGQGAFTVEFRSASAPSTLVDVGTVNATATMPMSGMAPMMGTVTLEPSQTPGRYRGTSELTMAGQWRLGIEWSGPAGRGQVIMSPAVQ